MILLTLSASIRISLDFALKHQERLTTINSICRDIDLKSTLSLIPAAFDTFEGNYPITSSRKSLAFQELKGKW
jgi:hypothetical protein